MEIFFAEQWKMFAESCIMGLIFGIGYDIIRVLHVLCGIGSYRQPHRGILPPVPEKSRRRVFLLYLAGDIVYMTFFTFFTSVFLFHAAHGQIRLYLVAGGLMGFLVYRFTAGWMVMAVSEEIVCLLKKLWTVLVWRPLTWCCRLGWKLMRAFGIRLGRLVHLLWRWGPGSLAVLCRRFLCDLRLQRCIRRLSKTMNLSSGSAASPGRRTNV